MILHDSQTIGRVRALYGLVQQHDDITRLSNKLAPVQEALYVQQHDDITRLSNASDGVVVLLDVQQHDDITRLSN